MEFLYVIFLKYIHINIKLFCLPVIISVSISLIVPLVGIAFPVVDLRQCFGNWILHQPSDKMPTQGTSVQVVPVFRHQVSTRLDI